MHRVLCVVCKSCVGGSQVHAACAGLCVVCACCILQKTALKGTRQQDMEADGIR